MEQNLGDTVALLSRTPAALDALLRGLPETWTAANEGDDSWTPRDIIGHLIHGEHTDWMPRVKMILQSGDTREFVAFDRLAHTRQRRDNSLEELLDEFSRVRAANLAELRALQLGPEHMGRRGRHPTFGSVTLSELLATWVAHDLTHLHQVSRVLAHQYRDAVGPWVAYLGVLHCGGHSA
jgi:DinB superfamily